jgi:phage FluMu protein Com
MLESVRSRELFRYIKSPHYFQTPRYKELNQFINQGEYEVYILGHSCGISDRTLLNEIFENEDCKSIRIFYHEREDLSNNKLDSSIEIMKHFTDKKRMRKIIKDFTDDDKMVQLKI